MKKTSRTREEILREQLKREQLTRDELMRAGASLLRDAGDVTAVPEAEHETRLDLKSRGFLFMVHPLSGLWLIGGVILVGALLEAVVRRTFPWEALSAAGVVSALTRFMAKTKGVAPWPWSDPEDTEDDD
jgi:hypothetical protein